MKVLSIDFDYFVKATLKERNEIPDVPVFLNSPMAITATEIYCRHHKEQS